MSDTDLIRDTLIHIEALQALLAAMRVGRRTPEKALDTLDRTASVPRRLQEALAATPAPLAPHPGQNHEYRMTCLSCGEPGHLFVGFCSPGETFRWSEAQPKEAE